MKTNSADATAGCPFHSSQMKACPAHAKPPRGLMAWAKGDKPKFEFPGVARFGRLFPGLPAADFGGAQSEKNLKKLAKAMVASFDAPKDGPDPEESGIPSLYTYFGQFVDHDLTFDPVGTFQKHKDPNATEDFRSPAFDLDNVYGRGPGDQPYLYAEDGIHLLLGDPLLLGTNSGARDLPRNSVGRALIGDPRNDENTIVSQFQGLFYRFHNQMVDKHPHKTLEEVQDIVRHHYQYVVLYDFLPRIVHASVLDTLKDDEGHYDPAKLTIFKPKAVPFMPVEFSVAAYRLGHSMVRPGYRLNDATLVPIFANPPEAKPPLPEGLFGFRRVITDWGIDWARFIDIETLPYGEDPDVIDSNSQLKADDRLKLKLPNFRRLQFAYRLDTSIVDPLGNLPESVTGDVPPQDVPSLAERNLLRGLEFGLPSGQAVAKHLKNDLGLDVKVIKVRIGKGVEKPDPTEPLIPIEKISPAFEDNCPLWTYILAEAMQHQVKVPIPVKGPARSITTPQLGAVGGRIVAEVFLGLAFSGRKPFNPEWAPKENPNYKLKDLVEFALKNT